MVGPRSDLLGSIQKQQMIFSYLTILCKVMGLHDDGLFDETTTWYNMNDMIGKIIDDMIDDEIDM